MLSLWKKINLIAYFLFFVFSMPIYNGIFQHTPHRHIQYISTSFAFLFCLFLTKRACMISISSMCISRQQDINIMLFVLFYFSLFKIGQNEEAVNILRCL